MTGLAARSVRGSEQSGQGRPARAHCCLTAPTPPPSAPLSSHCTLLLGDAPFALLSLSAASLCLWCQQAACSLLALAARPVPCLTPCNSRLCICVPASPARAQPMQHTAPPAAHEMAGRVAGRWGKILGINQEEACAGKSKQTCRRWQCPHWNPWKCAFTMNQAHNTG